MRFGKIVGVTVTVAALIVGSAAAIAHDKTHKKSRVHVEAPYTQVDVDESVHVDAPYTNVDVGETVRVDAPYTKVRVKRGQVRVRAPYVNLDIRW